MYFLEIPSRTRRLNIRKSAGDNRLIMLQFVFFFLFFFFFFFYQKYTYNVSNANDHVYIGDAREHYTTSGCAPYDDARDYVPLSRSPLSKRKYLEKIYKNRYKDKNKKIFGFFVSVQIERTTHTIFNRISTIIVTNRTHIINPTSPTQPKEGLDGSDHFQTQNKNNFVSFLCFCA